MPPVGIRWTVGDVVANTLQHLLEAAPDLRLPMLMALGLGHVLNCSIRGEPLASYGRMTPRSPGKDSTSGHWELAGVILHEPLGTFQRFPDELVRAIEQEAEVSFIGNCPASGTQIIADLGAEHMATGRPILCTSADHGNDATFHGTDHTREQVPLLVRYGPYATNLGVRSTLADVAATLTEFFGVSRWPIGTSMLSSMPTPPDGPRSGHALYH